MQIIKVGIIGGAGYTGGELIRILAFHPQTSIEFVYSKSQAKKPVHAIHTDLFYLKTVFTDTIHFDIDILFLCLGHHESKQFLEHNKIPDIIKIIDLSQDFRLKNTCNLEHKHFVYGLTEMHRDRIKAAKNIANPGCFATAIQLSLIPLASSIQIDEVYISGTTGSTGSGQSLSSTNHFSWRANNLQPYKTLTHQHLFEINESIEYIQSKKPHIHFLPFRGNFTRGIFTSSTLQCSLDLEKLYDMFITYYQMSPFVYISKTMIDLKQVINTNNCLLHIEKEQDTVVVHCIIDNLIKGAVGQAIQNMNLMCQFSETCGLQLKANYF
ncbi:MAG: N-acetyl-gamma-glutamyl-phosphate reductase [Alphaproteobacteria bacterium]|nr:N-acetyl-gamma-glutamyl-phosphate reductase [Alphaproteobacteria bacterium]